LLQKGNFVDGKQSGTWQRWHDNGALMDEGMWHAGKRSGDWVFYNPDGSIRKKQTFR
jgi:antitoxin component YwqK of YwqJK toxin-antitoxin module